MSGDFYSEWRTKDRIADGWHDAIVKCAVIIGVSIVAAAYVVSL